MTRFVVRDDQTQIRALLRAAGTEGTLVETGGRTTHALLPLNEQVVDYLLETSPRLIEECARIRKEMDAGAYYTHEELKQALAQDSQLRRGAVRRGRARASRRGR
jgi:hypothetical protein